MAEANLKFDVAYTSMLKRAIRTLWHGLEQTDCMSIPIINAWQLNERHYGALQGMGKKDTVEKYGNEQVTIWRRSYDVPPPPVEENSPHNPANDPKYESNREAASIRTESLKTTLKRVLPYWEKNIAPTIKSGRRVIIAAHGNSLRALVKYLDNISEADILKLDIPTAVPLVYTLDENLKPIPHKDAIAPLKGVYLGDIEQIKKRIEGVKNQTK
jgi:2,3-bisphosphoglycerate-dependent phosphoglycerate mutase